MERRWSGADEVFCRYGEDDPRELRRGRDVVQRWSWDGRGFECIAGAAHRSLAAWALRRGFGRLPLALGIEDCIGQSPVEMRERGSLSEE